MVYLDKDVLTFAFPEVHPDAKLQIRLKRTVRVPDDGSDYFLPPDLGNFPIRCVDDYASRLSQEWIGRGGVMVPMHQAEALWLGFGCSYIEDQGPYPFAVKIGTGMIDAVTSHTWSEVMNRQPQDYVVAPKQPWLDGYAVGKGVVRQFVAMPLGRGYSVEEQIKDGPTVGGIQIKAFPMKRDVFEHRFPVVPPSEDDDVLFALRDSPKEVGLAPGGRIRQQIFDDPYDIEDWDLNESSRCFVHLCNATFWEHITGQEPPLLPQTAQQYTQAGKPWFDYHENNAAVSTGSAKLASMETVVDHAKTIGDEPIAGNQSVLMRLVVNLKRRFGPNDNRR